MRVDADLLRRAAYGGSTIVAVFPAGKAQWDDDLLTNSTVPIETAVRVSCRFRARRFVSSLRADFVLARLQVGEKIGRFV